MIPSYLPFQQFLQGFEISRAFLREQQMQMGEMHGKIKTL